MPGGQQIDIADQPVTAAREAQPARRADGWMWVLEEKVRTERFESKQLYSTFNDEKTNQNTSAYCSGAVYTCKDARICTDGFSISQIHPLCPWLWRHMSQPVGPCWKMYCLNLGCTNKCFKI